MYKATRLLIDARQQHTNYMLQKVNVLSVPIGEANKCHDNTFEYQMKDGNSQAPHGMSCFGLLSRR